MEIIFKCLVFFLGLNLAACYDVNKIDIHTSDCQDCGMSAFGQLSIKLCGNGAGKCCVAENLDNLIGNDFNEGETSSFTGSTLGECNGFDMGEGVDWDNAVTLLHSGFDGGQFDTAIIHTTSQSVQCFFHKFLDGNDYELGSDCVVV